MEDAKLPDGFLARLHERRAEANEPVYHQCES